MAKVIGPLMSVQASGTLKDTITFRCGEFVHKKKKKTTKLNEAALEKQEEFKVAAFLWSEVLTAEQKLAWKSRVLIDRFNVICNHWAVALPLVCALYPLAGAMMLGLGPVWISGYDAWMSYYLTLGEYGWPNYPAPPPFEWKPPNFGKIKTKSKV